MTILFILWMCAILTFFVFKTNKNKEKNYEFSDIIPEWQ